MSKYNRYYGGYHDSNNDWKGLLFGLFVVGASLVICGWMTDWEIQSQYTSPKMQVLVDCVYANNSNNRGVSIPNGEGIEKCLLKKGYVIAPSSATILTATPRPTSTRRPTSTPKPKTTATPVATPTS